MGHFGDEEVDRFMHAGIAYIVFRLITGKKAASLYDVPRSEEIDMRRLGREGVLSEFDIRHHDYTPGYASEYIYRFASNSGFSIEIFFNEKTFILLVRGSCAYFVGNVRGDAIYLYDHGTSAHFRFRVTHYAADCKKKITRAIDNALPRQSS